MEKGYDFLKDDHCFIEALNQMFYNERKRFHARISNIDGANDQFSQYLKTILNAMDEGAK